MFVDILQLRLGRGIATITPERLRAEDVASNVSAICKSIQR